MATDRSDVAPTDIRQADARHLAITWSDGRESRYEVRALRHALSQLPVKYRDVLVLQVLGGYSGAEISEMLGVPQATVNTRLFRARQRLRAKLEEEDDGGAGRSGTQ